MRLTNIQFYKPLRTDDALMKPNKFKEFKVTINMAKESRMITVEDESFNGHHIYFLHGGSYVCEAVIFHRHVIKLLVKQGFRVTYISYPLAPESKYNESIAAVIEGWNIINKDFPKDIFHLFGDSAGGGMAVSLLKKLRDLNKKMPDSTLLSSPWLDLSLSNLDEYKGKKKKDMLLDYDGLLYCAKSFAGELDLKDEYLSPLYGDLSNLGKIIMFYSRKEMFCIDCELFYDKIQKVEGTTIMSYFIEGMFHDYLMLVKSARSKRGYQIIYDLFMDN